MHIQPIDGVVIYEIYNHIARTSSAKFLSMVNGGVMVAAAVVWVP